MIKTCRVSGIKYNLDLELQKCKNSGEESAVRRSISVESYRNTDTNFDKENFPYKVCVNKCPECGYIIITTCPYNKWKCSKCGCIPNPQIFKHVCLNCGKVTINKGSVFTCSCGYLNRTYTHECPKCGCKQDNSTPVNRWQCPECGSQPNPQICKHICPDCGKITTDSSPIFFCSCGYSNRTYTHECPECGKITVNRRARFSCECGYTDISYHHKCLNPECGYEENNRITSTTWRCPECGWVPENSVLGRNKYCSVCNKETWHIGFRCFECNPWAIGGFNREEFYEHPLELIDFDFIAGVVEIKDIDAYKGVIGVWAIETKSGETLDVCKTKNLSKEMLQSIRTFGYIEQGIFSGSRKSKKHVTILSDIPVGEKPILKLVAMGISEEEAWLVEAQYAHDNQAKYWNPEPGQNIHAGHDSNYGDLLRIGEGSF